MESKALMKTYAMLLPLIAPALKCELRYHTLIADAELIQRGLLEYLFVFLHTYV